MTFLVQLNIDSLPATLPINYQYPLSAAIYKILERADRAYSAFLHDTGYKQAGSLKAFKLFTFSDLTTPFKIQGDRLILGTNKAELRISFHLPEAAENFIKGLFMDQKLEIGDKKSRVEFAVAQVEVLPSPLSDEAIQEILLQPVSPIVCGKKNERGHYDFLSPDHPEFAPMLLYNWHEKMRAVYGVGDTDRIFEETALEVIMNRNPPRSRLITIKAGTPEETKIKGYVNFRLKARGSKEALTLLLDSGVGVYNSLGMGAISSHCSK